jgi:hypothetical protein
MGYSTPLLCRQHGLQHTSAMQQNTRSRVHLPAKRHAAIVQHLTKPAVLLTWVRWCLYQAVSGVAAATAQSAANGRCSSSRHRQATHHRPCTTQDIAVLSTARASAKTSPMHTAQQLTACQQLRTPALQQLWHVCAPDRHAREAAVLYRTSVGDNSCQQQS